jgi:hypothetical protein
MSSLEHENDNSSPPIPNLRICEPVTPLPHTPSQGGIYGRIILFCRNTTLRKRSFSSPITAGILSCINSWYEFRSPHRKFVLPPCYYYQESKMSQFGVTMFSTVNTRQVLWIQVHWSKSWNVRTRVFHGELKGLFRFLDGKNGWKHCLYFRLVAVDNYASKFPTHFPGWSAQDFVWTRQIYRLSIN